MFHLLCRRNKRVAVGFLKLRRASAAHAASHHVFFDELMLLIDGALLFFLGASLYGVLTSVRSSRLYWGVAHEPAPQHGRRRARAAPPPYAVRARTAACGR